VTSKIQDSNRPQNTLGDIFNIYLALQKPNIL
jgi:hypothetical protein